MNVMKMSETTFGERIKKLREENAFTQKELAKKIKVTPMAISQWENNTTEPKGSNLRALVSLFDVTFEWLLLGVQRKEVIIDNAACVSIPFYENVAASAGLGTIPINREFSHVSIDINMLKGTSIKDLVCIKVTGESMEPVLLDSSIIIIDMTERSIRDGKIYVVRQEEIIRVKSLSYTSTGIKFKSYNSEYNDENYTFQELSNFEILGRVVCQLSYR
ncbi:XRE family transcriptional regulator [Photobacterium frigidiphilum]|nr:S24 family peptidase [Photobacterium frigidiphilum]